MQKINDGAQVFTSEDIVSGITNINALEESVFENMKFSRNTLMCFRTAWFAPIRGLHPSRRS